MDKPFHREQSIFEKARALKKASTPAENKLWQALRNQKLKNCKFRRQHPIDIFILDFYCHEKKLAIEIDGGVHDDKEQKEYDAGRTFELEQMGIKVIRFKNEDVLKNLRSVLKTIERYLTPNPSPAGRGEQSISKSRVKSNNETKKIESSKDNSCDTQTKSRIPSPVGRGTESEALQGEVKSKNYVVVEFVLLDSAHKELLSALLPDYGFEGIEELESSLKCYIPEKQFSSNTLKDYLNQFSLFIPFTFQSLPDKNWNEAWEKSYEPIIVSDSVIIKASFHQTVKNYPFEILIDPQMSFGTGHHETTQLMVEMMLNMDFGNKSVLDFGSGTGVLSILAHKMIAKGVVAIDIDEWAYNNVIENIEKNHAKNIKPLLGGSESLPDERFEIVLANVNKNILIENMEILVSRLIENGTILFSGLLLLDEDDMVQSTRKNGLILLEKKTKNEWLSLKFQRQ